MMNLKHLIALAVLLTVQSAALDFDTLTDVDLQKKLDSVRQILDKGRTLGWEKLYNYFETNKPRKDIANSEPIHWYCQVRAAGEKVGEWTPEAFGARMTARKESLVQEKRARDLNRTLNPDNMDDATLDMQIAHWEKMSKQCTDVSFYKELESRRQENTLTSEEEWYKQLYRRETNRNKGVTMILHVFSNAVKYNLWARIAETKARQLKRTKGSAGKSIIRAEKKEVNRTLKGFCDALDKHAKNEARAKAAKGDFEAGLTARRLNHQREQRLNRRQRKGLDRKSVV